MKRYKDYTGIEFGDFKVIKRIDKSHVLAECKQCGLQRIFSLCEMRKKDVACECGTLKICPVCGKSFLTKTARKYCSSSCKSTAQERAAREKLIGSFKKRKVTKTTKMLVCVYYAEGASVLDICIDLRRNPDVITEILRECINNGEYLGYVERSLYGNLKRARERAMRFEQMGKEA